MKSKTATATKIVAVIYMVFTGLYTLSNLFLIPAINDYLDDTWADKQIFGNVITLSILLVNLIAIILYLVCTSKKPVSIGVLLIPFILWFLIFTVGEIKDIVEFMDSMSSSYYRYASRYRSEAITSYFISEAFYVITAILFRLCLYTLVPKTISDALTGGKKKAAPQQPAYQQQPAYAQPQGYQQPAQPAYTQRPAAPQQPAYTQRPAAPQQPAYQQPAYQQRPAAPQQPAYQQPTAPQQTYRQADDYSEETSYLPPDAQPPQA